MKYLPTLLLAVSMTATAQDQSWYTVTDSTEAARLQMELGSMLVKKVDDSYFMAVKFRVAKQGEIVDSFVLVTDVKTCIEGGGTLYRRDRKDDDFVTTGKFWWSPTGSKLFDAAGDAMCKLLKAKMDDKSSKGNAL